MRENMAREFRSLKGGKISTAAPGATVGARGRAGGRYLESHDLVALRAVAGGVWASGLNAVLGTEVSRAAQRRFEDWLVGCALCVHHFRSAP